MYRDMGFEVLETRIVEPRPGWSFRSHLICLDVEKVAKSGVDGKNVQSMASAATFASVRDSG